MKRRNCATVGRMGIALVIGGRECQLDTEQHNLRAGRYVLGRYPHGFIWTPAGSVTEREEVCMAEIYHSVTIPLTDACYRLALGSLEATEYNLGAATAVWRQSLLTENNLNRNTGDWHRGALTATSVVARRID